jgi:hypothetical protein
MAIGCISKQHLRFGIRGIDLWNGIVHSVPQVTVSLEMGLLSNAR